MKEIIKHVTLLMFITSFGFLECQRVTLFAFSNNDSLTKCTHGLVDGVDTVVFKSLVDYSTDPNMSYFYFQTKKKTESNYNRVCHFKTSCPVFYLSDTECQCRRTKDHVLDITITIRASVSYSGATLRGTAIRSYDNLQIRSQEQVFPDIYDLNSTTGHFFINGKLHDTTSNNCEEYISGPDLNVTFVCIGELTPCLVDISANDSTEHVHEIGQVLYYRLYNKSQELIVTVKYSACSIDGLYHTVSCKINIARVDNFMCHSEISKDTIKVTCRAIVFSNMNCRYFINKHDIKDVFPNVTITRNIERLTWTQLAHTTNCEFNLLKANIGPGQYDVVVVMHPSVDGYDDDIKLGSNRTISFPIMRLEDISCVNDSTNDVVNVSCNVARIYPQAKCRVVIIGKNEKIIIPETNLTLVNELVLSHATYYTSRCVFTANTTTFNPGHYELTVTIHPNVTGSENDLIVSRQWSADLHIRDYIKNTFEAGSTHVIAYVVGVNMLIVLLAVIAGYNKLRDTRLTCGSCFTCVEGKMEPGNYDVINQGYLLVDAGMHQGNNEYDTSGYILIGSSSPNENTQQIESDQQNIYETIDDDVLTSRVVFLSNIQHIKVDINKVDTDIDTRNGETSKSDCNSSSSTSRTFQLGSQDQALAAGTNIDHSDNKPCASSCNTKIDTTDNHPMDINTNDDMTYNHPCGKVDETNNHPCGSNINVEYTENHIGCSNSNVDTRDNNQCCNSNVDTTDNHICCSNSNVNVTGIHHRCNVNVENVETISNDICGSITNVDIRDYHSCGSSTNDVTTGT